MTYKSKDKVVIINDNEQKQWMKKKSGQKEPSYLHQK